MPRLLVKNTIRFNCGEREIWSNIKKSQNIINMIVCKIFFSFFKKNGRFAKNGHTLPRIYFIFLRKCPRPNLTEFQHQIWSSVKRPEK